MYERRVIAVSTKWGINAVAVQPEALCDNPCRYRLLLEYPEWSPRAPWGVRRYTGLMAVEPIHGVAGGTPVYCPSSHCYKLEYIGPFTGFWDRGAETLAAHMSLCDASLVWTRRGPWVEAIRSYARRVSLLETESEPPEGYCADILHNPFFHEGGATLVYEVYEQIGVPDAIIAPGFAPLLESIRVGLERLEALGFLEDQPRIYAVDVGMGIPRWLVDSLDLIEVYTPRTSIERGARSLQHLGFKGADPRVEAARILLLESGEIGRDERIIVILTSG